MKWLLSPISVVILTWADKVAKLLLRFSWYSVKTWKNLFKHFLRFSWLISVVFPHIINSSLSWTNPKSRKSWEFPMAWVSWLTIYALVYLKSIFWNYVLLLECEDGHLPLHASLKLVYLTNTLCGGVVNPVLPYVQDRCESTYELNGRHLVDW